MGKQTEEKAGTYLTNFFSTDKINNGQIIVYRGAERPLRKEIR